jgi:hypothetical protein
MLYRDFDRHPSPSHGDNSAISFLLRAATADDVDPQYAKAYRGGGKAKRGPHQTYDLPYETKSPQNQQGVPYLHDDEESEAGNRKLPAYTSQPAEVSTAYHAFVHNENLMPSD